MHGFGPSIDVYRHKSIAACTVKNAHQSYCEIFHKQILRSDTVMECVIILHCYCKLQWTYEYVLIM